MRLGSHHLTYCTNIHPGESWGEVFGNLKKFLPSIKRTLSPEKEFGIGLRLSDMASKQLLEGNNLNEFKDWLSENSLYVFTLNGFPYGGFHGQKVKDAVHKPDWTTQDRVTYTIRLCNILAHLLPENMEGGISTSPISYKPWFKDESRKELALSVGCQNIAQVIKFLDLLYTRTGKIIHLDLEPEPDGLIENSKEVLTFVQQYLLKCSSINDWETIALRHFRICYDVCHFAIEYEEPEKVFHDFQNAGILIGKIQLSAALKIDLHQERKSLKRVLDKFAESTYLHQVIAKDHKENKVQYLDLPEALNSLEISNAEEWRTHFHVPLFIDRYQLLESTQEEILKVLQLLSEYKTSMHLEVETYTWEVLPEELKLDMQQSIERELEWVRNQYQTICKEK